MADLVAEVEALATALGVMRRGTLDPAFFSDPLGRVRTILSDPDQRAALLTSLDAVLPPGGEPQTRDGQFVSHHPLVATSSGTVAISITRSGAATSPDVIVGLHADAHDDASGIAIEVDLPLVNAVGTVIEVVAGAAAHPLAVGVLVPVGWQTPAQPFGLESLSLSALVLAPPDLERSRVAVELTGLDLGSGPTTLTLDPMDLGPDFSHALTMLLIAGLRQSAVATEDSVQRLIQHLPIILGLDELPMLPLGDLVHDPRAFRDWLASLVATGVDEVSNVNGLYTWVDEIGQLLGAPKLPAFDGSLPTSVDPIVLTVVDGGAAGATVELLVWLETPPAGTVRELHVSADVHVAGEVARLVGRADLLVVPLGGDDPARPLTSAEIVVESNEPLLARTDDPGTEDPLTVGRGRGGLRWNGSEIVPVLEFDDVHVDLPGVVQERTVFPRLDLSHAKTLAAEAKQVVGQFVTDNLGPGTVANTIGTLLGFSLPPTAEQLGAFANDPMRAIRVFHRQALDAGTYGDVAQQIVGLFGVTDPVAGAGTPDDPWTARLTQVPIPAGSNLVAEVRVWDDPEGDDHNVHIGLGLVVPPVDAEASWSMALVVDLVSFRIPAVEAVRATLLGAVRLEVTGNLPDLPDASVHADELDLVLRWQPGDPLDTQARVSGVSVRLGDSTVDLGDLGLPDGLTSESASGAWAAVRELLARAARSWGGPSGAAFADLLGLSRSDPTLPTSWPMLELPAGGLDQLLADPLGSLRGRLAELVTGAVDAADADGQIPMFAALDLVRDLLSHNVGTPLAPPTAPLAPDVAGSGTYDDPWAIALTDAATPLVSEPIDLIAWMEPGPPKSWAAAARELLDDPDALPSALAGLSGLYDDIGASLAGLSPDTLSRWLTAVASAIDGTDGMTPTDIAERVPPGVVVSDVVPTAAHARAPKNPDVVTAARAHLQANAAGDLPLLLVGPSFAPDDVWSRFLDDVSEAEVAGVDLRVPGVDPAVVDLSQLAVAKRYVIDLADDGTASIDTLHKRLDRVVQRVCDLTGSEKVGIVAHSIAAIPAVSYASTHPEVCQACVTVAAPFDASVPPLLADPDAASGVRLVRTLCPSGLPVPSLEAAIAQAESALNGYTGGVTPTPYPAQAFARAVPAGTDLSAVPTLAITTALEAPVLTALSASVAAIHDAVPDPGSNPTHLSWGLRARLDLGAEAELGVDLTARADLGRVALRDGVAEPDRPAHRFVADALVYRPEGWLVGDAGTGAPLDIRLRAARMRYDSSNQGASFTTTLYDGAVNGSGLPVLGIEDARAARLIGALVDALSGAAQPGSAASALVQILTTLEILSPDTPEARATMRSDAIEALLIDPAGWLAPRVRRLLQDQPAVLGLVPDLPQAGLPRIWRRPVGNLPVELVVRTDPWSAGVRTTGAGLPLAAGASIAISAFLPMDGPPTIETDIAAAGVTLHQRDGVVKVSAPPLLDDVQLLPPTDDLASRLVDALGPTGLAAAASAALEDTIGGVPIGSLVGLLVNPAQWLAEAKRFGDGAGGFDAAAINAVLRTIGEAFDLGFDTDGLVLAEGMHLSAGSAANGGTRLRLAADALPLVNAGPVLDLALALDIAPAPSGWTVRPHGQGSVTIPLSGGAWPNLEISAALDDDGFSLSVTPGNGSPVPFLPHFPGLWDLIGGGVKALLPGVLDRLVQELSPMNAGSVLERALAVADGLELRSGAPPSFDSDKLATLVEDVTSGDLTPDPATVASVVSALLPVGSPIRVATSDRLLQVGIDPLPTGGGATLAADFGAGGAAPTIDLHLHDVVLGPVTALLRIFEPSGGAFGFDATLQVDVPTELGFDFTPAISVSAFPLAVELLPLGAASPLTFQLAPTPGIAPDRAALGDILVAWAEPIAAKAALEAARPLLDQVLWTPPAGTPLTAHSLLRTVGLIVDDAAGIGQLVRQLPDAPAILRGLLAGLGSLSIPVSPDLDVRLYTEGPTWIGIGLAGSIDIDAGDIVVEARLGVDEVASWTSPAPGLGLLLLDNSGGLTARPGVRLGAVGVRVRKKAGPLVDTDAVDVGDVTAFVQAAIDLDNGSVALTSLHGGVRITQIGLPLGGSSNPSNPIAASLLKPAGAPGDDKPASPAADLTVVSDDSGVLDVKINSKAAEQPFFVDIHKTFGPLHIDRIGLRHLIMGADGDGVGALVDGGVAIAGLTVDVQGLELDVPLKHPAEMDLWRVDLAGLALSFAAGPVSIEGGLLKTTGPTGAVEYDGQVKVEVASFGLTALAGYSQAVEQGQPFTSLFVFVVVDAPLGGPPFLFVTGLAGGAGYNRQLIVPTDPNLIPSYPLVRAMSDGVGTDPMGALHQMSKAMPPRRGSYWVAAGVKFTTFELINTKALAYVALDRGFEVGVMGLMTMALPTPDTALVSVELALQARYSTADQLLALRAQLTNNSWLVSRDCQLTGGFAFYSWFGDRPSVYFTIGGHGPLWDPDEAHPEPAVPVVGFRWSVMSGVVVKGGFYFALSPREIAFGGNLEASAEFGPIRVWFGVWLDVWLEWDPLHYAARAGITIGAAFHFTIDLFFGSITINISVSIGGSITLAGPPLHGSVTVDLEIASVTVEFGSTNEQLALSWPEFAAKFLSLTAAPDSNPESSGEKSSVATVAYGQLADSNKGPGESGETPDGTHAKPWRVIAEFGMNVASKMPVDTANLGGAVAAAGPGATAGPFDVKPMGSAAAPYAARLELRIQASTAAGWSDIDASRVVLGPAFDHFPTAVWLKGAMQPPAEHRDMWRALAGATLGFPVSISEATGVLGETSSIPISTLVAEGDTVKPLPFTTTPQALRHSDVEGFSARLASGRAERERRARRRDASPRLVASVRRGRPSVTRTRRVGTSAHAALATASRLNDEPEGVVALQVGEAHVWAAPTAGGRFEGRGGGDVRVTTLSATGYVLDDREGPADQVSFDTDEHAARVVVSGMGSTSADISPAMGAVSLAATDNSGQAAGWQSHSTLTQVAGDTLLGSGCAVLLPTKLTAPRPAGVERVVTAGHVMSRVHGVQTLLPRDVSVVVVLLDELEATAADDLVVTAGTGHEGSGSLSRPDEVIAGQRRCLVYPVAERPRSDRLPVAVASARAWRLAGVVGVHGDVDRWVRVLGRSPHVDLVRDLVEGAETTYVLAARKEVPT